MNVLWDAHILKGHPSGGVARYCSEQIRYLCQQAGTRVMSVCEPGHPGFPVDHPGLKQITSRKHLDRWRIARFRPDVFQSCYYGDPLYPGLPTVQIAYDFIDARFPAFQANRTGFVAHQRKRLEEADHIIAISETTRKDISTFTNASPERTTVLYPTLPVSFRQDLPSASAIQTLRNRVTSGAPYLLWVGPTTGYKNFRTFLKAYARMAESLDLHLVIAGRSPVPSQPDLADPLIGARILDRVHPQGFVTDSDLRQLYAGAEALVQSSLWEGFGIPLIEALASGTQLIVSDIPVFREIAGDDALYASPYSVEAWQEALSVFQTRTLPPEQHLKRREEICRRFSPEKVFESLPDIYHSL